MRSEPPHRPGSPPEGADPDDARGRPGHHRPVFWILVVAVGVGSGLASVALLALLRQMQHLAWLSPADFLDGVRAASATHRIAALIAGGVLAVAGGYALRQRAAGHGGGLAETIWFHSGDFPFVKTVARGVLSIVVVAFGASLGREGALKQTGAAIASALARASRLPPAERRLLAACGAAGGFAAAYDLPLGGALFALEVLLGTLALELVPPVLLASTLATLVSRLFLGDRPTYLVPAFHLTRGVVAWSLVVGPLLGAVAALFVRGFDRLERMAPRGWVRVVAPVLVMGVLGVAAIPFPELLGNGKGTVQEVLLGRIPVPLLAILPVLKFLFVGTSAGAGIPGGLFTPTLCVGALAGGFLGAAWSGVWPGSPVGAYALVGMGALVAGTTQGPVSAVVLVMELTGQAALAPALIVACAAAVAVSHAIDGRSVYTVRLRRGMQAALATPPAPGAAGGERIPSAARYGAIAARLLLRGPARPLLVVDDEGHFVGRVTGKSLRAALASGTPPMNLNAADAMEPSTPAPGGRAPVR